MPGLYEHTKQQSSDLKQQCETSWKVSSQQMSSKALAYHHEALGSIQSSALLKKKERKEKNIYDEQKRICKYYMS